MIQTAYTNILETATSVALAAGTADASYPLTRIYDRDPGRTFRTTAAVTTQIVVNQGASPLPVDRLIIAATHNLAGMALSLEYSTNGTSWSVAVTNWTGAAGLITKSFNALTKQYWRFTITTPSAIPQIAELFLASTYAWPQDPERPGGPLDNVYNVRNDTDAAGHDTFLMLGAAKRKREYSVEWATQAQHDAIVALDAAWAGAHPFWLLDHTGTWIFVKFTAPLNMREVGYQSYSFDFKTLEVIP